MIMPTIPHSWGIVAGLALTLLVTSCGWHDTYKKLGEEKDAKAQLVQTFSDQQKEANRRAEAKRKELKEKGVEDAKAADAKYANLYDLYESNLLRYQANQRSSRGSVRNQLRPTGSSNGSSTSTEVLAGRSDELWITMSDGKICAVNTARLQAVREWALKKQQEK